MALSSTLTDLSAIHIIYGLLCLLTISTILNLIRAHQNPLSAIPGPWYAPYTSLPLKYHTNTGRRMFHVEALHRRYGPIVRLSPSEIDVSDRAAYKEMSRMGSGFVKSSWYPIFRTDVSTGYDLFSLTDSKEHARRRALFKPCFEHAFLVREWEGYVVGRVRLAVEKVKGEARVGRADVFKWWNLLTNEVMGRIAFGEDLGLIEAGEENDLLRYIHNGTMQNVMRVEWGSLYYLLKALKLPALREYFDAPRKFFAYARKAAFNARNTTLSSNNIFAHILAAQEKDSITISDDVISIEAEGLMTGGSSTIKNTSTYLVYEVLRHPEWQARLEEEVAQLPEGYTVKDLENLPVLNAILYETLRYHAAAPGALRRTAPAKGATLGGYHIPGGTTVAHQAYSLNRNTSIFPNPDVFDPTRFLDASTAATLKSSLGTFGAGNRVCIGIHLAYIEMRHIAAEFFRECRGAKLAAGTDEKCMEAMEFFGIEPRGMKCEITLGEGV